MSSTDKAAMAPREGLPGQLLRLRRGSWEALATVIIGAGVIMLMQPFFLDLYSWSFVTVLTGTVLFVIVSHFRD